MEILLLVGGYYSVLKITTEIITKVFVHYTFKVDFTAVKSEKTHFTVERGIHY